MLGIWLEDGTLFVRDDLAVPERPAGEALIKVLRAGICNTDLELVRGYYPYAGILGHEFVGEVVSGAPNWLGKRVVGEINAVCRHCKACHRGRPTHCENRTVLGIVDRDGAFAEYLSLPIENLHEVPEGVSIDAATFTEPLAAALEIQVQLEIDSNDRVLVAGIGKLGSLIAQSLALIGCEVIGVSRRPEQSEQGELLASRGIRVIGPEEVAAGAFDVAVEATGNPAGFELARRAIRPRGTLVMKSTYFGTLEVNVSSLVVDETTLVGSRCGPFAPALELLAAGRIEVEPLIEHRYGLASGLEAFEKAAEPGVRKVLLDVA